MTIEDALERIEELERLLENAIYITDTEWRRIKVALEVSPTQAAILVALFKASNTGLFYNDLDAAVPMDMPGFEGRRKDFEFRTSNVMKVQVCRLMQRYPGLLKKTSSHPVQIYLSERGIAAMRAALCP